MKSLYILDLDHTLIYGSYATSENVDLLLEYNQFLKVYKRPLVMEFIKYLNHKKGDIIVYTTAKEDYAKQICRLLKINLKYILAREDCVSKTDKYYKKFSPVWGRDYENIFIIDDSPNIWLNTQKFEHKIKFIVPREFRGEPNDREILGLIRDLE